jgi:hypothetical protein
MVNALKRAGFSMTSGSQWNILWTGFPGPETIKKALKYQRINHFPGSDQIGRKDLIWRNVSKMIRKWGKEYQIMTHTYVLPEDYKKFKIDRELEQKKAFYILKPTNAACGRGIRVIHKKSKVSKNLR